MIPTFIAVVKPITKERARTMQRIVDAHKEPCMVEQVVLIRPCFMRICDSDACRAAVYNHLLYWIGRKLVHTPLRQDGSLALESVTFWKTYEELAKNLAGSWGVCKIRQEIKKLVADGLIGQKNSRTSDRTKHYFFTNVHGETLLARCKQAGICLLHLDLPHEIVHLLEVALAFVENNACICPHDQMQSLEDGACNTKITTKKNHKEITLRALANATPATLPVEGIMPAQKRPRKAPEIDLTSEQEERARTLRQRLNELRKYPLRAGVAIQENKDLRKLVRDFTDEQIDAVLHHLLTSPFLKWSKAENKYKITGTLLLSEIGPYLRYQEEEQAKKEAVQTPVAAPLLTLENAVVLRGVRPSQETLDRRAMQKRFMEQVTKNKL
jgi:hypothetical protein